MKHAVLHSFFFLGMTVLPPQAGDAPVPPSEIIETSPHITNGPTALQRPLRLIVTARELWQQAQQIEARIRKGTDGDYIKLLNELEAKYQQAIDTYGAALRESPQNAIVFSDLGRLWLARQDRIQARKNLTTALIADDNSKRFTPVERADIHRTLGGLLERSGFIHAALEHYKHAFRLNEQDVRNRLSLAIARCASGSPHESVDILRSWCQALPAKETQTPVQQNVSAVALYTLALSFEEVGQPEEALTNFQAAWERCSPPEKAENWGVLERAESAVERLEDAIESMEIRKIEREAENKKRAEQNKTLLPDERESYATAARWVGEGLRIRNEALADKSFLKALATAREEGGEPSQQTLEKTSNWESFLISIAFFQRAATIFPRFGRAYYELAASNMMLGRYGEARKLLGEAVACSPNNISTLNLYGDVLLQLGQWNEAQKTFKRLRALEPESARANLGWAQATAGLKNDAKQVQQALDALDRAEQLGVDPDEALRKELVVAAEELKSGRRRNPPKIRGRKNRNADEQRQPQLPDFWRGSIWDR